MNPSTSPRRRLSRHLRTALQAAALALGASALHAKAGGDPALPGEILVKLSSTAALAPLLAKYALVEVDRFGARPIYRLRTTGATSVKETIDLLGGEPTVLLAEPNFVHAAPEARRNQGWAIGTAADVVAQWAPAALHLAEAQQLSSGAGVRVAVLDTGVDRTHPLLAPRLLPGFDFVDADADPSEVGSGADAGFGHGTHVAGIVAQVAPGALIMPLRVLDAEGRGNAWVLAEAMLYAVDPDGNAATDDGAKVINMSLGSLSRTHLMDAIAQLVNCVPPDPQDPAADQSDPGYDGDRTRCAAFGGAVMVAAAGNDASKDLREYPAAEGAYGLIAVGASNASSRLASFSNFGGWVQVAAPGEGITSSVPHAVWGTWSGTSMAAPMAAGLAALLHAREPGLNPDKLARRIELRSAALCNTTMRRIDPLAALLDVPAADPACP